MKVREASRRLAQLEKRRSPQEIKVLFEDRDQRGTYTTSAPTRPAEWPPPADNRRYTRADFAELEKHSQLVVVEWYDTPIPERESRE